MTAPLKRGGDAAKVPLSSSMKNGKTLDISSLMVSPLGVVRSLSVRGIIHDVFEELEKSSLFDDDNKDAKEQRKRTELLLDNNERILEVIYGYKSATDGASNSDSDCESDYEEDED